MKLKTFFNYIASSLFLLFWSLSVLADPPTDIALTPSSVAENQSINTVVGTLTTTDPDIGDIFTYTLVGGAGSTDNGSFNILGDQLRTNSTFDFETKNTYYIRVRSTDLTLAWVEKQFTINVTDVNDAPVITSNGGGATASISVTENTTAVTTVTASDEDIPAQTLTYSITGGMDQSFFTINSSTGVLEFITAPDFENPLDFNGNNIYNVQVTVTDDGIPTLTDVQSIAVTVQNENEPPVLDGIELSTLIYTENNPPTSITTSITITDPDDTYLDSATVTISSGYLSAEDTLTFVNASGITGSWNDGSGRMRLTGHSLRVNYQTALRNVRYTNTSENPSTGIRTISFTVNDGDGNSNTLTRNLSVTPQNDVPVLDDIEPTILAYTENDPPTFVTTSITVTDPDDTYLESATVTISPGYLSAEDTLTFTNANGISGTWNDGAGRMTLTGHSLVANYQTALRNVRYTNTSDNPSTGIRTISFTVNDGDGDSNTPTRYLSITPENDAPVLDGIELTTLVYTENDPPTSITTSIEVTDPDDTHLESAIVTIISPGYLSAEDTLTFVNANGIIGSWNDGAGRMTLTGHSLVANYQTALRNVKYANTSENPSTGIRTISFTVNDGDGNSNTLTRNISITPENNAPVLSGIEPTTLVYTENDPPTSITTSIMVTDPDDTHLESATVTIISPGYLSAEDTLTFVNANGITGSWNDVLGTMTLSGHSLVANYQTALRNVKYANTSENPSTGIRTISFTVNDGDGNSNTLIRNLSVAPLNDAPLLEDIETTPLAYIENDPVTPITQTLLVTDVDDTHLESATVTITSNYLSAEDTLTFTNANGIIGTWNDGAGRMTLTGHSLVTNYQTALRNVRYANTSENPTIVTRVITFRANDGDVNSIAVTRNLTITAQNDPPVASDAAISGTHTPFHTRELLTAEYTYTDPENNPELGTTFKWFTANNDQGAGITQIAGAVSDTFTTRFADGAKWISMVVIPRDNLGLFGDDDTSSWYYINAAPEMQNLAVVNRLNPGAIAVGETVSADYDYYDAESNPSGAHQFQWYRSNSGSWTSATAISGETDSTYLIRPTDNNRNIAIETYPHATVGSSPGPRTRSSWYVVGTLPTATISGNDSICNAGEDAELTVNLTGENPPWSFKYTINGANETEVNDIAEVEYTLIVTQVGFYELTEVSDAKFSHGHVSGTGTVSLYPHPTAVFTEGSTQCEQLQNKLNITFTGKSPWDLTYRYESETPIVISDITLNPFDIPVENLGDYTLISVSDANCAGTATGTIEIIPAPEVTIFDLDTIYALDPEHILVPFHVIPEGSSYIESDPNTVLEINDTLYFSPYLAGSTHSPHMVRFSYTDPGTGCVGKDSLNIYVLEEVGAISVYGEEEPKIRYCFNEDTIQLVGVNIDQSDGYFSISGSPDALINTGNNTADLIPGLILSGTRTVTYHFTISGLPQQVNRLFTFEMITGDFYWDNECFNDGSTVTLIDTSMGESQLDSFIWKIQYPDDIVTRTGKNTTLTFQQLTTYPVELVVMSEYNCTDTVRKDLILKPTFNVNGMPFIEDFQDGQSLWFSFASENTTNNSWTFGLPDGEIFDADASEKAWYTDITNDNLAESSYVISPCFDFSDSKRPMIKMDIWRGFIQGAEIDGAILQYTTDNGTTWEKVGNTVGDGIKWYNSTDIDGEPGGEEIGWTSIQDTNWIEARHKLDDLINKTRVRFRVAYGVPSGYTSIPRDGIAFDNFWIGERSRKVLIEHFTNAGDPACIEPDETFNEAMNNNKNSKDIIDVQYHVGHPGPDPFYDLNPDPANSREIYYGIPSIPYGLIDGGRNNSQAFIINYSSETLNQNDLTKASLADNIFDIDIQVTKGSNMFYIYVTLKSLSELTSRYLTLHTIVIEDQITEITGENGETSFESVVKEMLPDAGGTAFNKSWTTGETKTINLDYNYEDVFDENELRVVAFIQDETTKTVYQAEIINPNIIIGIDPDKINNRNNFIVFPNPASSHAFVKLLTYTTRDLRIELYNSDGRLIDIQEVAPGEELIPIPLYKLDVGFYLVRLVSSKEILGTEKLIHIGNK